MAQMRWWEFKPGPRFFTWNWKAIVNHSGNDLQAPCGTLITSPVNGTVVHSGVQPWGGQIDVATDEVPGYGPIIISWVHTSQQFVQAGEKVAAGENLGTSGQPPPGGKYGGGCHIHFEVTHGTVAPYDSGQYSPSRNPDAKMHPMDPGPLLEWLRSGHAPPDQGGGYKAPAQPVDCGPEPKPSDPDYANKLKQWLECQGKIPTPSSGDYGQTPIEGIGSALGTIAGFFGAIKDWVTNPLRVVKMVLGIFLVAIGLVIAFLPDFAAAGAAAAGAPELAPAAAAAAGGRPKQAIGSAIRAGGRGIGAQRAEQKKEQTRQRATAKARTLEETRLQRIATTRRLKPAEQAQYTTLRAERGAEQERAARTAPLGAPMPSFMLRPPNVQRAPRRGPLQTPPIVGGGPAAGQPTSNRRNALIPGVPRDVKGRPVMIDLQRAFGEKPKREPRQRAPRPTNATPKRRTVRTERTENELFNRLQREANQEGPALPKGISQRLYSGKPDIRSRRRAAEQARTRYERMRALQAAVAKRRKP